MVENLRTSTSEKIVFGCSIADHTDSLYPFSIENFLSTTPAPYSIARERNPFPARALRGVFLFNLNELGDIQAMNKHNQPIQVQSWLRRSLLPLACGGSLMAAPFLAAQDDEADDQVFELTPFEVDASEDRGYRATSTLGGTRINTNLRDVGSAISVLTKEFMDDIGATSNETLLQYTTNTETGGVGGNFGGSEETNLLRPNTNNRVRGLAAADNTRDFFLTDLPWDGYNVERVDMQRGPNSILFGLGSPAGIINNSTTGAMFSNTHRLRHRIGSYGGQRIEFNINRVLLEDQLAVRIAGVETSDKFRQEEAWQKDSRQFIAFKYEPEALKTDSARTTITANYEIGNTNSNRPRSRPPEDRLTNWWNSYSNGDVSWPAQLTADPFFANTGHYQDQPDSEAVTSINSSNPYWAEFFTAGPVLYFEDGESQPFYASVPTEHESDNWTIGTDGNVEAANSTDQPFYRGQNQIAGYSDYAREAGLPLAGYGGYNDKALTDRSIFDYKNHLIDGPNKYEWRDFNVFNAKLAQTFLNGRVGIEGAYDTQDYEDGQSSPFPWTVPITVDLSDVYPDGSPNPNVGRPYILNRANFANNANEKNRDSWRVTAFAKLRADDFLKEDSFLARLLGSHNFTAMKSGDEVEEAQEAWKKWVPGYAYTDYAGDQSIASNQREMAVAAYIGPDMRGLSSPSGLNLSQVTGRLSTAGVSSIRFWDSHWKSGNPSPAADWNNPWTGEVGTQSNNPDNYLGWTDLPVNVLSAERGNRADLLTLARKNKQEIESEAFVWQAYLWNGAIVPTYGYRKDSSDSFGVDAPFADEVYFLPDPTSSAYVYPTSPDNSVEGSSDSYSVVVHTDRFFPDMELPGDMKVSLFYNESSNFEPSSNRVDHLNRPLGPPSGETEDYGFVIEAFEGRLIFKMNKYETVARDRSFDPGNLWMLGTIETSLFVAGNRDYASLNNLPGYDADWQDYRNNPWPGQTADEAEQYQSEVVDAALSNIAPQEFWTAWNAEQTDERWMNSWWDPWSGGQPGAVPANFTSTTNTTSTGTEFELNIQPTNNWDIAINASKVEAVNTDLAGSLRDWVDARNEVFNGRAGDIRYWWAGDTFTVGDRWNRDFYAGYQLALQKQGTAVDELREWRANMVTNYRFNEGKLKGFSIGGSMRWEDEVGIGYPQAEVTDPDTGITVAAFGIDDPWMAPSETHIDLFARYGRKIGDGIDWSIQLNIRDVTANGDLIAVDVQPDGSPAFFRIGADTTWFITNTFDF